MFTLPAYIKFFNNDEVLGLWYTILSLLNWILNFDLGIGNGLRNHLSDSLSLDNKEDVKRYLSSAYFSIGMIAVIASLLCPIIIKFINLNSLLNINEAIVSSKSLYIATIIVFIGVMLQFWLKLINSVLYALQKTLARMKCEYARQIRASPLAATSVSSSPSEVLRYSNA